MPTINKSFNKFTSKSSKNNEIVNEAIKHQYALKNFARTLENYEVLAELDTKQYSLDSLFAMDIGGSLAKIIFYDCNADNFENTELKELFNSLKDNIFSTEDYGFSGIRDRYKSIKTKNGCIHFILFETQRIKNAVELIFQNDIIKNIKQISCTGGGSYKFEEYFRENYDIEIKKYDEFKSLLAGLNALLKYSPNESYHYRIDDTINDCDKPVPDVYDADAKSIFPYLLVNVGSGVSVLHVKDEHTFERVSGSGIGGATFFGLVRALTNISSFDEALQASRVGNSANVNMLVGDIYGGEYQSFNLPAEMVASFFGKFAKNDTIDKASDADICNALLVMITNNVGQVAYLNAMRYNLSRIYFSGNFLRSNVIAMKALAKAIHFWSHGEIQAHFLKHEGYFGALGTFFLNNLSKNQ
ncbi:fumble [Neocallimastix lanati (nom. inval.)]|jgi:type II pantothenate kinase|nr:fumble [Neocallimastix sp. JGI-2020a]